MGLVMPPSVRAQGVGFVGGGTIDPEGFFVGTFFETRPIAGAVRLRPGVDGTWGDDLRVASINIDIIHRTDVTTGWQFYTGGGPNILITRADEPTVLAEEDELTGGFGALIGFGHASGFFTEFKYGYARHGSVLKFGAGVKIGGRPTANPSARRDRGVHSLRSSSGSP
jgi:hypothetical protein